MIYFDNAATTLPKPRDVIEAVTNGMMTFGGPGRGTHEPAMLASMSVYEAREAVANLLNVGSAAQVAFCSNATHALNIAIEGLQTPGSHAITTAASHNSALRPLYKKEQAGAELSILSVARDGSIDLEAYEALFRPHTSLVVLTHASNLTGDIYDVARMTAIAHEHGALVVLDAAQTAGSLELDMQGLGVDVLAFTGHKSLFGPQGTGGLCVAKDVDIPAYMVGGAGFKSFDHEHPSVMPEKLEAGTLNASGLAGLAAGVAYIQAQGVSAIHHHTAQLTAQFEEGVLSIPGARRLGHMQASERCPVVSLAFDDIDSSTLADLLAQEYNICTRAGAHCAPLMHQALHTTDLGAVRFSFSALNSAEEIATGIKAVQEITHHLRS